MVVDIDSNDWRVWQACERVRPPVVVIEHHDRTDPGVFAGIPNVPAADVCGHTNRLGFACQANYEAVWKLGIEKGYEPVWTGRINTIFVRGDLADKARDEAPVRLNIGAGKRPIEGYISVDIKDGTDARSLPYPDNSVDEVYAAHVLEHFGHREVPKVLEEWARVLKPNGLMRISVPDRVKVEAARTDSNDDLMDQILMGGQVDPDDFHKSVFTEQTLARAMRRAGIGKVEPFDPIALDCSNINISANVQGRKRWFPRVENPNVVLVLSEPRLGFNGFNSRLRDLIRRMQLNEARMASAYWEQGIQGGIIEALALGADYILFADYDSIFMVEDYLKLLETMQKDPTCAAVGCVQVSRHNDRPLVFEPHLDYTTPTTRVRFSHFGLMLVRRHVFEELPKPWFLGVPDDDGNWGTPGASDPDITFWRLMQDNGFKVLQHNEVVIGHVQECVKYPGEHGVIYQPAQAAFKQGHPAKVKFNPSAFMPKVKDSLLSGGAVPAAAPLLPVNPEDDGDGA